MAAQRTALGSHLTERDKARARVVLLTLVALVCPPLAGIRSVTVWLCYAGFAVLYALWGLRLTTQFSGDRRLGYLLCLTDAAILLPLLVWSSGPGIQTFLVLIIAAGLTTTYLADRLRQEEARRAASRTHFANRSIAAEGPEQAVLGTPLERAVRMRLGVFLATGSRFALVVLRVARFEEAVSYYGEESCRRIISAVGRRGLRLLGPDAQHFELPGGRVAFLFETDSDKAQGSTERNSRFAWTDPSDIEGVAMSLGRKACEHLVDGRRVECVVGWASAPADGLNADDLMEVAEAGAQSTAAFRRVAGGQVRVPERARVAAG
jgi:GGDEF domain-containing protein